MVVARVIPVASARGFWVLYARPPEAPGGSRWDDASRSRATSDDRQLSPADAMAVDDDEAFAQQFMLDTAQNAFHQFDHFLVGIRPA